MAKLTKYHLILVIEIVIGFSMFSYLHASSVARNWIYSYYSDHGAAISRFDFLGEHPKISLIETTDPNSGSNYETWHLFWVLDYSGQTYDNKGFYGLGAELYVDFFTGKIIGGTMEV